MGNKYKEIECYTTPQNWVPGPLYNRTASLPRPNKNKIHEYNSACDEGLTPQYNQFCTLRKKTKNKSLSNDNNIQNNSNGHLLLQLIIRDSKSSKGEAKSNIEYIDSSLCRWDGKSWNKDDTSYFASYISKNSITTFCIQLKNITGKITDYTKVLKPLLQGVVSTSPTINTLSINCEIRSPLVDTNLLRPQQEPDLQKSPKERSLFTILTNLINHHPTNKKTLPYLTKLFSLATQELYKSKGEYHKLFIIGNGIGKLLPLQTIEFTCQFKQIKSKTHFVTVMAKVYAKDLKEYKEHYECPLTIPSGTHDTKLCTIISYITLRDQQTTSKNSGHKIPTNKSGYAEEDANVSVSMNDYYYDCIYNSATSGDSHLPVDDTHIYESL